MELGLRGKRALLTGSTAGIGFATARALAAEGASQHPSHRFRMKTGFASSRPVLSGIRLARHYVRGMESRDWGRIVFVSSESAIQIPTEMIHYGMTKTAQLAVARGLAETLAGTGVTVNSVLPGPTASEGVGGFVAEMAEGTPSQLRVP